MNPSKTTCAAPEGCSACAADGMKSSWGGHIAQTPPSPTSMLVSICNSSENTVLLVKAPVPLGSSKIKIRSRRLMSNLRGASAKV